MKFKKCGPEHEASYLFEVDKNWMRSGNDFSELLESIRKASNLAASAYRSYADGENAIDGVIETLSAMLRIEFENTKQKEDAESIGAALPVTQAEKWLSDTEMPDGVCMLSMTRKIGIR